MPHILNLFEKFLALKLSKFLFAQENSAFADHSVNLKSLAGIDQIADDIEHRQQMWEPEVHNDKIGTFTNLK